LVEYLPQFLVQRENPLQWLLVHGEAEGFIRPSSRLQVVVPELDLSLYVFAPADLPLTRKARYVDYSADSKRSTTKPKPTSPPRSHKVLLCT
jgi:hypothetical protein